MKKYDLVVIGGGAGGLTVAAGASSLGAKVALIEKEEQPGGDCLHYGCVPSKALIESAKIVHHAKTQTDQFGLQLQGKPSLDAAMTRVKVAINTIAKHDDADRFRSMGVDVYIGIGSFRSSHEIEISTGEVVYGKRVVISPGSRPFIPPIKGINDIDYITNETIFSLKEAPGRLLVIGGGPIGLELAQSLARFGSEVTVVERSDRLLSKEDEEIVPYVQKHLEDEMTIFTNATVEEVSKQSGHISVSIKKDDGQVQLQVDQILIASGRTPNTAKLNLSAAGVHVDQRGTIVVDDYLRTNIKHIFAVGDVNGRFPFTHVAGMEGKLIVQNAVLGISKKVNYDNVPWVTYTDPEVFHLGLTEREAKETYGDISVFSQPLADVDRFVSDHNTNGMVKIIANNKGKIIGAHAVGAGAGDWMQEIVYAKQYKQKIGSVSQVIHPYPNHAAAVQRTTDLYWREKLFNSSLPKITEKYIKWFR
ncbi:FAD-dependent oxidoreductase [Bacillus sp. SM2101]|uniref:dihydrolipoyl dehydrogenase family protein n=1 Tax=Bacillus sp. SM2101 TaxID=2805366 RepID=UPI001BDDEA04